MTSSGSASGSVVYGYDNNGNITSNGVYAFGYDYKNRLVQVKKVSDGSMVSEYQYDILGRRYEKKTPTETIRYAYADKNIVSENKTKGGIIYKKDYVNGLGMDKIIAVEQEEVNLTPLEKEELTFCETTVLAQTGNFVKYGWNTIVDRCNSLNSSGSTIVEHRYFLHKDHLGSIVGITDNSGNVVSEYSYDVFGKATLSGSDIGNDILFTGREYDGEIGLYYLRARYYSADMGRFISRDPIGQVDDVNVYSYVGNSPMIGVDPSGKSAKAIIQIFRDSGKEMKDFRDKSEWSWWNNDLDPDLNNYYMESEFHGLGRGGKYDLIYGGSQIQKDYDQNKTGYVTFNGEKLNLGEISNVLTALNAQRLGFSQEHLENSAMITVILGFGNGVDGEMADRKLYDYGYILGSIESNYGELTDDQIIRGVKEAVKARNTYIK